MGCRASVFIFTVAMILCASADRFAFGQSMLMDTWAGVTGGAKEATPSAAPTKELTIRKKLQMLGYVRVGELVRESDLSPYITTATDDKGRTGELIIEPTTGNVISFEPK